MIPKFVEMEVHDTRSSLSGNLKSANSRLNDAGFLSREGAVSFCLVFLNKLTLLEHRRFNRYLVSSLKRTALSALHTG